MQKRLLIIAYYFPPLGLSGVQRVLKWSKYLPNAGWDVTVLTARPGSYFAHDDTLLDELEGKNVEIIRTSSFDPTRWAHNKYVGLPRENSRQILDKISQTLFQPDNKIGWYPFAVARGKKVLSGRSFDAIYSSAPPYTSHLIGKALSRYSRLPLIIDYRDDWINNPRHHYPSHWHRRLAARMERSVFAVTSGITTINDPIRSEVLDRARGQVPDNRIRVFPHGFDPEDFVAPQANTGTVAGGSLSIKELNEKPVVFVYSGVFYDAQKPDTFLRALAAFIKKHEEARPTLRARFVGLVPEYTFRLVKESGLDDVVVFDGYVKHSDATRAIAEADVLWMTVGETEGSHMISTSKLYEYFGTGNPILGLVPSGTARTALEEYGAAEIVHPDNVEGATMAIGKMYNAARNGSSKRGNPKFIEQFDRKRLAVDLGNFLDAVCLPEKVD